MQSQAWQQQGSGSQEQEAFLGFAPRLAFGKALVEGFSRWNMT